MLGALAPGRPLASWSASSTGRRHPRGRAGADLRALLPGGEGAGNGSGLGLAIAKGFVEANGGEIEVESLPGQGSSFVVSFPAVGEGAK